MMRAHGTAQALFLLTAAAASACEGVTPAIDWNRMIDQPRLEPQAASALFGDGRAMRQPPAGTVPYDRAPETEAASAGRVAGQYRTTAPIALGAAQMARGRDRYELICATCHGVLGDGASVVAQNMELRKPPSLLTEPARSLPEGRVFEVISQGYGLMPSYAQELSTTDRWAVIGYLRALRLSQAAERSQLPPEVQRAATEALR